MKVSRATVVFSPAVISSLEFLQKNPKAHERASEFRDYGLTITFMKIVGMCFKYTLTWALNNDPLESLLSCFQQFNGGNDRVDAKTTVFTTEKLLKVGVLQAARSGNALSNWEFQTA
ncbi:hypothetical protein MRX96_026120 [Rhipicephalus microplus]